MSVSRRLLISGSGSPTGEQVFTSSATWTAPKGVYRVSVVAIGRGGDGVRRESSPGFILSQGGGGGGLGWRNDVSVVPDQEYTVSITTSGSYFINLGTVWGQAGTTPSELTGATGGVGGNFAGDGGGLGGDGSSNNTVGQSELVIAGGGDAGNYNSDGADGVTLYGQISTDVNAGEGSGISGNDVGNYGFGGTEHLLGGLGVVQIRWGVNKDYS